MANIWDNPEWFAKETLMQLENVCVMANLVHRGFESDFQQRSNGWKTGDTISIKTPSYARTVAGPDLTGDVVDFFESSTDFQITQWRSHIKEFGADEYTWDTDEASERIIQPAVVALADYVDRYTHQVAYQHIPNQVGTPGTYAKDYLTMALAWARLDNMACPPGERYLVLDPMTAAYFMNEMKYLYHQAMVGSAFQKARLPQNIANFETYISQNVRTHTCGTSAGRTDILVDDTVADEDTDINLDQNGAGAAYTFKAGEIFTIPGVYAVNPVNGDSTGELRQFVVTADTVFADVGGGDFNIAPAIYPGTAPWNLRSATAAAAKLPYQNIDALPVNNAQLSIAGSTGGNYKVPLAFHRNCISLAIVPIAVPPSIKAVWSKTISKNGFSITVSRGSTFLTFKEYIRFDILFDAKVINPDLGCRIASGGTAT